MKTTVANYETLFVLFAEPIRTLDNIFDDPEAWGVASLKEWIDSYESSRFTQTDERTAGHNLRIQHDPCKGVVGAAYAH